MASGGRMNYSRMARIEWCQLILFNFPVPFISPIFFLFTEYKMLSIYDFIRNSLPQLALILGSYILLSVVVAKIFNGWRIMVSGVHPELISYQTLDRLEQIIETRNGSRAGINIRSILVNPKDLTMGAHVRGVISPSIVVSGGMLVGLLRNDPKAWAILNHEAAHIEQYDMLLPGYIGFTLIEIFGTTLHVIFTKSAETFETETFILPVIAIAAYKLLILGGIAFALSRAREYYADAGAIATSADRQAYMFLLSSLSGSERSRFSLFHPSIKRRIEQVNTGFPAISLALAWRGYFVLATLVSAIQWKYSTADMTFDQTFYAFCGFWMGLIVLSSELFRDVILKSSIRTTPYKFPKPLLRYVFLLGGFTFAAYIADTAATPILAPLVGGGVYVIFRATKSA